MRNYFKIRLLLGAFLSIQTTVWAGTVIVAESGGDYTAIQEALNHVTAGDSILVKEKATPYYEKITFPVGGNADDGYVSLLAFPGEHPVLDGTGVANNPVSYTDDMVYIEDKSYVRLIGFEIRNVDTPEGSGVRVFGSGSYIEIRNNEIHEIRGGGESGGAMGITIYGANDNISLNNIIIDNNHIYDCDPAWSEALTLNGNVEQFEVTNNLIEDVNNIGIDFIGGEDWLSHKFARSGRCAWNRVFRANSSYEDGYAAGIYVDGGNDIVIENNTVSECDLGIEIGAENSGVITSGITVRNNIVYANDKTGIVFGGYDVSTGRVKNCDFTGNTCFQNDALKVGNGELWIQYAEDNTIRNNIFYANDQNLLLLSSTGNINNLLDYNLWYTDSGSGSALFIWNGTSYTGFSSYQSGTGQDEHSMFSNPDFINAPAADFHISGASPAIDLGDPSFIPAQEEQDMDGQERVSGIRVDAGADEINTTSSAGSDAKIIPGNLVLFPASPNPFNPQTTLQYQISVKGMVDLSVYNIRGQRVIRLVSSVQTAGRHYAKWNGKSDTAKDCSTGVYFARLNLNGNIRTEKLFLLK